MFESKWGCLTTGYVIYLPFGLALYAEMEKRTGPALAIVAAVLAPVALALVLALCCLVILGLWYVLTWPTQVLHARAKRIAPCAHGVKGAAHDGSLCPVCTAAARVADELRRRQEEERRLAEEAARRLKEEERLRLLKAEQERHQKAHDAHLASIRLPSYLLAMDPRAFELHVCELYRRMGCRVEATPRSGDHGIDGHLYRDGRHVLLQCKRVKGFVGEPVLRDLFGSISNERADGGIVVTTGRVSTAATKWAAGKPIQIIELDEITKMTKAVFPEHEVVPDGFVPGSSPR